MLNLSNPAVCLDLLRSLHPVDAPSTHEMLARMIRTLLHTPPAANQHLEVLEAAREALAFCQHELARRYSTEAAQPGTEADHHLQRVVALWRDVARSYALVSASNADDHTLFDERALLAQRRLHYAGRTLIEHFRARRMVPPGLWADVHAAYRFARADAVDSVRVADRLNEVWRAQSPGEAYVAVLLADLANPFGRSNAELGWILHWVERFAPYCRLDAERGNFKSGCYGLDLDGDEGLRPLGTFSATSGALRFDGSVLAGRMRAMLTQFKRGVTPAALGLGADCPAAAGARLLLSLYRPWGRSTAGRRFKRRPRSGRMEISSDWLGIGFAVAGELFHQPAGKSAAAAAADEIHLRTFGDHAAATAQGRHAQERPQREAKRLGFEPERWDLLDQSVGGFRICRNAGGESLDHRQLVGVRPDGGRHCLLGDTRWLMIHDDGRTEAGIEILPGVPQVVAIRAAAPAAARLPFQQAFLLPGSTALDTPPSLVVQVRWFQKDRLIELNAAGDSRTVRLTRVLRHGANFDQCAFDESDAPAAALSPA